MPTVPNQRTITINKAQSDKQNRYSIMNLRALENAMLQLSGEALKMWLYFNKNQHNYSFALSRQDCIDYGIGSESSYKRAINELITKGYLINTLGNHYIFNEYVPIKEK